MTAGRCRMRVGGKVAIADPSHTAGWRLRMRPRNIGRERPTALARPCRRPFPLFVSRPAGRGSEAEVDPVGCPANRTTPCRSRTMRQLFTPIAAGSLSMPNRVVIAPMCQYSAEEGRMTDWHMIHLGQLALSGAGRHGASRRWRRECGRPRRRSLCAPCPSATASPWRVPSAGLSGPARRPVPRRLRSTIPSARRRAAGPLAQTASAWRADHARAPGTG